MLNQQVIAMTIWKDVILSLALVIGLPLVSAATPGGFVKTTIQLNAPPSGLAFDSAGVLYALEGADFGDNEAMLRVVQPDGTISASFPVTGNDANNFFVGSMAYDPIGDQLLITDNAGAGNLYAISKNGAKHVAAANVANIAGVAVRNSGEIFVSTASGSGGEVLQVDRATKMTSSVLSGLGYGAGHAFDPNGNLLVQDANAITFAGRLQRLPTQSTGAGLAIGTPQPLLDNMQSSAGVVAPSVNELYTTGVGGLYQVAGPPFSEVLFDSKNTNGQFATAIAFDAGTQPFRPFSGPDGGRLAYQADFGFESQEWIVTVVTPADPGDYNADGVVNGADYSVWRGAYGTTNAMADGNLNGIVDAADYVNWRQHSQTMTANTAGQFGIPEPSVLALTIAPLIAAAALRRARA
jgi:hypothetical protein